MFANLNPATGEKICDISEDNLETIQTKFNKAKHAQKEWACTDLAQRKQVIQNFRDLLTRDLEECASVLTQEMGKPLTQARNEISATRSRIDFFLQNVDSTLAGQTVFQNAEVCEKITWEPLGVIANISAWNYPYFVGTNVFIPALLAGNAVLYKSSEITPLTGLKFEALLREAGLPEGVFATISGTALAGEHLLSQSIDGVFFTGSKKTGEKIAQTVAHRMIKMGFELGGKDPAYVTDEISDVKKVAEALADGAFYNAGQSCCSVERIYVHQNVYKEFVAHFVNFTRTLIIGNPQAETTYIGPLARKEQMAYLEAQVKDAVSKGAKVAVPGGKLENRDGWFFAPIVLTGVDHTMDVMHEESFGPIIGIMEVSSDDEAVRLVNDTEYGLTSSVYCANNSRAQELLTQFDSGTVYLNCCDRVSANLPWTGRRGSGIGSSLSKLGITAFVQPKAWHCK